MANELPTQLTFLKKNWIIMSSYKLLLYLWAQSTERNWELKWKTGNSSSKLVWAKRIWTAALQRGKASEKVQQDTHTPKGYAYMGRYPVECPVWQLETLKPAVSACLSSFLPLIESNRQRENERETQLEKEVQGINLLPLYLTHFQAGKRTDCRTDMWPKRQIDRQPKG